MQVVSGEVSTDACFDHPHPERRVEARVPLRKKCVERTWKLQVFESSCNWITSAEQNNDGHAQGNSQPNFF